MKTTATALPPKSSSLRARLRPDEIQKLLQKHQGVAPVIVRPSGFAGLGVFCMQPTRAHEIICYFRGAAVNSTLVDQMDESARFHHGRYMICTDDGDCCVPLRNSGTEPPRLPDILSGFLINEACSRPEGEYNANVYIIPAGTISKKPCPWLGRHFYDWEVRASRNLVPGEELLLCYGPSYGERLGYRVCRDCEATTSI